MASSNQLRLRGKVINDLAPNLRPTCMVFQSLALFPHMSVGKNVEFPLNIRGVREGDRRTRAWELLKLLHLDPNRYYDKNVTQCSGGERPRAGLPGCRASWVRFFRVSRVISDLAAG